MYCIYAELFHYSCKYTHKINENLCEIYVCNKRASVSNLLPLITLI